MEIELVSDNFHQSDLDMDENKLDEKKSNTFECTRCA